MENFPIQLSENILLKAKLGQDTSMFRRELYFMKQKKLEYFLNNDELKGIFWINIYNAYVLILANESSPEKSIFKYKRIKIARHLLSLNDIEFRILGMYNKPLYKFIGNLFSPSFVKQVAIKNIDINCQKKLDRTPLIDTH